MKPTHAQLVNLLREIVRASPQVQPWLIERARQVLCLRDDATSAPAVTAESDVVTVTRGKLRAIEWGDTHIDEPCCPVCHRRRCDGERHAPECWLAAALRAPAVTGEAGGCLNCAEKHDGGYYSDEGNVGPFCEQCWHLLRDQFAAPPAAGAPPDLVALVQDWQAKYALMNELVAREEDPNHDQAAENRLHAACRAEEAAHRALLAWSPAPAPVARKPFQMNVSREWVMRMAEIEAETLGSPSPAPAPAAPPAETPVPEDGCTVQFEDMKPWPAPPAVAGGDAQLAPGEMPPSSTWGDLGRAAKCSRCDDDGQPCSHCEQEGQ